MVWSVQVSMIVAGYPSKVGNTAAACQAANLKFEAKTTAHP
jgi:hypothetical protein